MGKKMTKKSKKRQRARARTLQAGALVALLAVGIGAIAGLAALNSSVRPDRDMQWYVRDGAVQVAAPASDSAYATTEYSLADEKTDPTEAATDAPTEIPTEAPSPTATHEPHTAWMPTALPAMTEEPPTEAVTLTITAAGDCTLGGDTNKSGYKKFKRTVAAKGYDYFFKNFRPLFQSDDLTIVNLEGPLTVSNDRRHGRTFNFKGEPENVAILSGSGVEICNVANNHALDFGTKGLQETADVLEHAGIGCSGYSKAYYANVKGVRVGSLGFTLWDYTVDQVAAAVAEARTQCDLLIVSIHWGIELDYSANKDQQDMGRAAIDAGADLVLGTHPHVVQGIEKYNGKYIVYSLGNFCFGGSGKPTDTRCLVFQQAFRYTPGAGISDAGINLIPGTVTTEKGNNFQPAVLSADQGAKLLRQVAKDSYNLSLTDTLWMPDNYMVRTGLMAAETAAPAGEAGVGAEAEGELTWEEKLKRGA